jgi:hypothetical protein
MRNRLTKREYKRKRRIDGNKRNRLKSGRGVLGWRVGWGGEEGRKEKGKKRRRSRSRGRNGRRSLKWSWGERVTASAMTVFSVVLRHSLTVIDLIPSHSPVWFCLILSCLPHSSPFESLVFPFPTLFHLRKTSANSTYNHWTYPLSRAFINTLRWWCWWVIPSSISLWSSCIFLFLLFKKLRKKKKKGGASWRIAFVPCPLSPRTPDSGSEYTHPVLFLCVCVCLPPSSQARRGGLQRGGKNQ